MKKRKGREDFFIGWSEKMPIQLLRFQRRTIFWLFLIAIVVGALYALSQKKFNPSTNELGSFQKIQGVIYEYPVPLLKVKVGNGNYQSFILVGVGKHSANKTIDTIKYLTNGNLRNYEVVLKGSAIYYDGKTLLEVPAPENTMDSIIPLTEPWPDRIMEDMGEIQLQGEIIDPKCYFGVMNPAYGKIHRSCAIRCISGGVPPVLRIHNNKGVAEYFLLLGENGQPINQDVLQMVGLPVYVKGNLHRVDDWFVLKVNPKTSIKRNYDKKVQSDYINDIQ
ncbi:MAG: hypothetical protein ACEPOW_00625 [Bacteroidales bacterium]